MDKALKKYIAEHNAQGFSNWLAQNPNVLLSKDVYEFAFQTFLNTEEKNLTNAHGILESLVSRFDQHSHLYRPHEFNRITQFYNLFKDPHNAGVGNFDVRGYVAKEELYKVNKSQESKIKVAITYSDSVGGASVKSMQSTMRSLGADVSDADYRVIVPLSDDLEKIYEDDVTKERIWSEARKRATEFLKDKDCLMLSGNSKMVDPRLYGGEAASPDTIDLARSLGELALIDIAINRGMPILGICGGHQILNVYLGGTLGDLDSEGVDKQMFMDYAPVEIEANSELAQILEMAPEDRSKNALANFFGAHNQVVKALGGVDRVQKPKLPVGQKADEYLKVVARATDESKSIEAIEAQYGSPVLGLQFHPEVGAEGLPGKKIVYQAESREEVLRNKKIFEAFAQSAEAFKHKRVMLEQIKGLTGAKEIAKSDKLKHISSEKHDEIKGELTEMELKQIAERDQELDNMLKGSKVKQMTEGLRNYGHKKDVMHSGYDKAKSSQKEPVKSAHVQSRHTLSKLKDKIKDNIIRPLAAKIARNTVSKALTYTRVSALRKAEAEKKELGVDKKTTKANFKEKFLEAKKEANPHRER